MLTRRHAEVVAADSVADAAFRAECWSSSPEIPRIDRVCYSDEHYVPTVLAMAGMDDECACSSDVTYTAWGELLCSCVSEGYMAGACVEQQGTWGWVVCWLAGAGWHGLALAGATRNLQ